MKKVLSIIGICFILGISVVGCSKEKPYFEVNKYNKQMKEKQGYPYTTITFEEPSITTTGTVTVIDYRITNSLDGVEAREGYEWRILEFKIIYDDENAYNYGMYSRFEKADYYTGELFLDDNFKVVWKGKEYDCKFVWVAIFNDWENGIYRLQRLNAIEVPIGYDGCTIIFYSAAKTNSNDGKYKILSGTTITQIMDPDTLYFRFGKK